MQVIPLLSLAFKIKNRLECVTKMYFNIKFLMVAWVIIIEILRGGRKIKVLSALSYINLIFTLLKLFSEVIKPEFSSVVLFSFFLFFFRNITHLQWIIFCCYIRKKSAYMFRRRALTDYCFYISGVFHCISFFVSPNPLKMWNGHLKIHSSLSLLKSSIYATNISLSPGKLFLLICQITCEGLISI